MATVLETVQDRRLLTSVAEQLRVLLLQVARASELSDTGTPTADQLLTIQKSSQFGLQLVEHYLLGLQYQDRQVELLLEPVSLSAVMDEVAHELMELARSYAVELELHIAGKYPPIMADRAALKAAIASLGYGFLTATPVDNSIRQTVQLAAHRTPHGMVAGVYGDQLITADKLRRGRLLYGMAHQPIASMSAASGAGIFVADSLLSAMGSRLRSSKFQKRYGLGATFLSSSQLHFV